MFFQKNDCFEVSGSTKYKVIHADNDIAIVLTIIQSTVLNNVNVLNKPHVISNNEVDYVDKYWIKKIGNIEVAQIEKETL